MGGYFRPFDFALGRVMDIFMSFPSILLSVNRESPWGPSILNMCLSGNSSDTDAFARGAAAIRERTYVMAARSVGHEKQ